LIKRGLDSFSSTEVGALRIVITFLFFIPIAFFRYRKLNRKQLFYIFLVGIVGSGLPPFLFAKVQTVIDSHQAGILNSLTPLFTFLFGLTFFSFKAKWFNIAGIFIGLFGAAGLIYTSSGGSFTFNFSYSLYIIAATVCYATNVNLVKFLLKDVDAVTITVFTFIIIGLPVFIYLFFFTDFLVQITTEKEALVSLGYMAILAIVGTGLALIVFNKLIKISTPIFAASVTYLIPVIAVVWGIIDGEKFHPVSIFWVFFIFAGVYFVNKKPKARS